MKGKYVATGKLFGGVMDGTSFNQGCISGYIACLVLAFEDNYLGVNQLKDMLDVHEISLEDFSIHLTSDYHKRRLDLAKGWIN
jgi:hypothetical protein|tara:strand:- start:539 stop:787 length:249 start_codon:yes stop_codon:yes gene_type:complete